MNGRTGTAPADRPPPWWHTRTMWLVVGGPLIVVVAAIVTAVIAVRGADELVEDRAASTARPGDADSPAVKARNHAATPRSE